MWRNFGWTAVLATWTIFLILNSGLAGERILNKPRNNNEDTPRKVHHEATRPVLDKKVIVDSRLRYARENFKSNDRSSMHVKAASPEFKNTENRDSRLNGYEKHIAMSNAAATAKHLRGGDDKSARLITKRTGNVWLSKVTVTERSKNTRNYYLKFVSSLRPSLPTFQELKSASENRRRKGRTVYVFLSDHNKSGTMRHDTQAYGRRWKKYKRDRIFNGENGMTDKFTKNPHSEKNNSLRKFKNFSRFEAARAIESNGTHERNRNEKNSRQSHELTKNGANKLIRVEANAESQRVKPTYSNYSSSKENQSRGNETIITATNNTENSPYQHSVVVTWTTLIFNSKISSANGEVSNEENTLNPYYSSEDEYSKSYKADKFLTAETYRRNEYSKIGFKVSTDTSKKIDGNIVDPFTFRAPSSLNNHFAKKRDSFTRRPFLYKKRNGLEASDTLDHRSSTSDSDARINREANLGEMRRRNEAEEKKFIAADGKHVTLEIEPDQLPTNLSAKGIDESNLDYQMPSRISVTQKRNPMHVRHVRPDADCERPRRTELETEVRDASRIGLRNVSNPSRIAKSGRFLGRKSHGRPKYSRKFRAINVGAWPARIAGTTDGKLEPNEGPRRTSTESISISFGAASVSDNSTSMWKINGRVQSSNELPDEPGLKNVRVTTKRGENHRDMHEGSGFYSRSDGVHNSKYRRYKRHGKQNTPGTSTSTEFESGTWKTFDTTRSTTTSNLLIEFTADPSISTTQTNNVDQISTSAEKVLTSVEALPSSKYEEFQGERQLMMTDRDDKHTDTPARMTSDSLEIDAQKKLNFSLLETPFQIEAHDRSTAITKKDDSIIPKEVSSVVEANVRVSDATNETVFEEDVSATELINSQERHGAYGNESVWTIDPLAQRNSDPSQSILGGITTENVVDSSASDVLSDQWPVKHSAVVEGDLVLGGLMMVHEREDRITCGPVMPQGGIQALEAMLYTLDTLNDREIVPGVKIGAHILDDCDKDTYGLEMAVDFIKGTYASR